MIFFPKINGLSCCRKKIKKASLLTKKDWISLILTIALFPPFFLLFWFLTEALYKSSHSLAFIIGGFFSFTLFSLFVFCVIFDRRKKKTKSEHDRETKNRFLSVTSHELRTPLHVICGFLSLLLREKYGKITKKQKDIFVRMEKNAKDLIVLINNLLDTSRIESGKMEYVLTDFDLMDIAKSTVESMQTLSNQKNIALTITVSLSPHGDRLVCADEEKTKRVLRNLIGNAIKFTPEGGDITVRIEEEVSHKMLECSISDTGVGIPLEKQVHIFQRFHQVDNIFQKPEEGTGLGLSIVKDILSGMQGEISVKSSLGAGSVFTFCLPKSNTLSSSSS